MCTHLFCMIEKGERNVFLDLIQVFCDCKPRATLVMARKDLDLLDFFFIIFFNFFYFFS